MVDVIELESMTFRTSSPWQTQ